MAIARFNPCLSLCINRIVSVEHSVRKGSISVLNFAAENGRLSPGRIAIAVDRRQLAVESSHCRHCIGRYADLIGPRR